MARMFLEVAARPDAIPTAVQHIARFAAAAGLDAQACFQLKVIVAEALNNIATHGGTDAHGHLAKICCELRDTCLEVTLHDAGRPIDCLPNAEFPHSDAESGRGWPIMINWADMIEYRPGPGRNELTIVKALP